jgi:ABC-type dipeptide/oligopeptide/nickel transport system permease component
VLTCVGLLFLGSIPALFVGIVPHFGQYFHSILVVLNHLLHPSELTYTIGSNLLRHNGTATVRPLFPMLLSYWSYSMILLFASFFISFISAMLLTFVTVLLPKRIRKVIQFILYIFESMPDLLLIGLLQLFVIWLFQKTNILVLNLATFGDKESYALPLIVLSALPIALLYRMINSEIQNENGRDYVEFAKGKGMKRLRVLIVHISRNALVSIMSHSKIILSFMLSNLLIVEFLLNSRGLLNFMFTHGTPTIFTLGIFLFFLPMFLFFAVIQILILIFTKQKVVV